MPLAIFHIEDVLVPPQEIDIAWDVKSGKERLEEIERELNLNADKKRVWLNNLSSIEDHVINVSVPISMNYFK